MMTEILATRRRTLQECHETLDRPANADEDSRKLILQRYASELDIFTHELEDLLARLVGENAKGKS
jgi:hypothetical protein